MRSNPEYAIKLEVNTGFIFDLSFGQVIAEIIIILLMVPRASRMTLKRYDIYIFEKAEGGQAESKFVCLRQIVNDCLILEISEISPKGLAMRTQ